MDAYWCMFKNEIWIQNPAYNTSEKYVALQICIKSTNTTGGKTLTLRLLISYTYGAPSKARNVNVVYIWTYVWQRWNSLFLFAAQCFNTESMQRGFLCHIFCVNTLPASWQSVYTQMWHRKPLCIDSVLKHCAANRKRLFQRCQTYVHIYTTLAFLALLGAPYIYEIISLRVNIIKWQVKYNQVT